MLAVLNINSILVLELFIVIAVFLLINTRSTYSQLIVSLIIMLSLIFILVSKNMLIFAILLAVAELHVFYIVFCLTLTWYRFETIKEAMLKKDSLSNNLIFTGFFIILINIATASNNLLFLTPDNYIFNLIITISCDFLSYAQIAIASQLAQLAIVYCSLLSFEFFILNLLMFIAVICFYHIISFSKKAIIYENTLKLANCLNFFLKNITIFRQQRQTTQLNRELTSRVIKNYGSTLLTNTPKTKIK